VHEFPCGHATEVISSSFLHVQTLELSRHPKPGYFTIRVGEAQESLIFPRPTLETGLD
jgi:hypothetical protein